jgi:5'(3')-deoxyribonucleotidase
MNSHPKPVIAVDMDEVIADALGEHLMRYNREFSDILPAPLTPADLQGRWLWDAVPYAHLPALERYMLSDDFFRVLPVIPDAQRVLARLQSHYDIYIATAAMEVPSSFTPKFHWLAEHFPFIPHSHIVFCGNKSILRADFLIDDNPRQLRLFQSTSHESAPAGTPHREGILFSSPANANVTGFRRVNNWLDVESLFMNPEVLPTRS